MSKEMDHSDAVLKFIGIMLMEEEDLENKPCMLHDCLALQATEKSLYDVLNNNDNLDQSQSNGSGIEGGSISAFLESSWSDNMREFESSVSPSEGQYLQSHPPPLDAAFAAADSSREKKLWHREDGGAEDHTGATSS